MADLDSTRATPLHPGVDAQSWLGFEQRIQLRRFDALVASARQAIADRNVVLAEHALEEAREIRAGAPELIELDRALRQLQRSLQGPTVWRRAAGALALFAVGVSTFVALDETRITTDVLPLVAPPPPLLTGGLSVAPAVRWDLVLRDVDVTTPADRAAAVKAPLPPLPPLPPPPSRAVTTRRVAVEPRPFDLRSPEPAPPDRPGRVEVPAPASTAAVDHDKPQELSSNDAVVNVPARRGPALGVTAVAPSPANVITAANVDRAVDDESLVAEVLRRYARAYGALDVRAAREVWPNVDQRALARAFESLASQTVSFDNCEIDVHGTTANASCRGKASYVGKVGRGAPRTEPRAWRFELKRDGETWTIASAEARRISG